MIKNGPIQKIVSEVFSISVGQAKTLIEQGGIYVNDIKIDLTKTIKFPEDFLWNKYCVLRKGKKDYRILILENKDNVS